MVNTELLKTKIKKADLTVVCLAQQLGLSREGLYRKLRNRNEFKASEIQKISDILSLDSTEKADIFFAPNVD